MGQTLLSAGTPSKRALGYSIGWDSKLFEGVALTLEHPFTRNRPALFVGERFILRDCRTEHGLVRGCEFVREGNIGIAKRVALEERETQNGSRILLLVQPSSETSLLLHVITHAPSRYVPKERLQTGVVCDADVRIESQGEWLLSFARDGQYADILYVDGRVVRIVREKGALVADTLAYKEQANVRIAEVCKMLAAAKEYDREQRVKREDFALHQLVSMLAIAGRNKYIFAKAFEILEEFAWDVGLRKAVQEHAVSVLRPLSSEHAMRINVAHTRDVGVPAETVRAQSQDAARKRAEIERRRRENRANRLTAQPGKGMSSGGGKQKSRKK